MSIGHSDNEDFTFYGQIWIEVDSDGNIYVLNAEECRVQKFDENGTFQMESLFGSHHLVRFFESFGIMEGGNIMGQSFSFTPESSTVDIALADSMGKRIKTLKSIPVQTATPIQGRRIVLYTPYFPYLHFCQLDREIAVYGSTSEYRLFVTNSSGETLFIVERQDNPKPISREDKDKIIEDKMENVKNLRFGITISKKEVEDIIGFGKYRPAFDAICSDGRGNIYVMRSKSVADEGKGAEFDLFDQEGHYLYRITMPVIPKVIANGYLYSCEDDQDMGYIQVKRYKIKNWDQIKSKRGN